MKQLSFEHWSQPEEDSGADTGSAADHGAARRVFLGWDPAPLERAARWIAAQRPRTELLVALPGAAAARALQELVARLAAPDAGPLRFLTQGTLPDALALLERPTAGRLVRTLAWERALRELPDELARRLARRASHRPGGAASREERGEHLRLAETVRSLHAELAPEGVDFAFALDAGRRPEIDAEALRWEALARAQRGYRSLLARHGLDDPHDARRRAIREGRLDTTRAVVLVGVVDMNELTARALERLGANVTALIVAPPEEARCFDAIGRLRADAWRERDLPLAREAWHVCEKPVDQADVACDVIASWGGRHAAREVRVGIADEAVVPYLERRLAAAGARARNAAGTPLARSRPFRLLRALGRYLRHGSFAELAALGRSPDLVAALDVPDPSAVLDLHHRRHLPAGGRGGFVEDEPGERRPTRGELQAFQRRLEALLGALATDEARPPAAWAGELRRLLASVWPGPFDPEQEPERALAAALSAFGGVLGQLEEVPDALAGDRLDAPTAVELVLRTLRDARVPPAPARAGEQVVELYGWLDLVLDDAPALVVTGFNEGKVPQSSEGHAFLPEGLRRRLGLPVDADRLARDAYALCVLAHARTELALVSGRRSTEGDPLVPSRLAFHCPEEEVVARVQRFLGQQDDGPLRSAAPLDADAGTDHSCPAVLDWSVPEHMSVSSFRTYLRSPYRFLLERVLRVDTLDDRDRELDPLRFGILAHDVLEAFGARGPRDSIDPAEIHAFLSEELARLVARRYGARPLPAIVLQKAQLDYRLGIFAARQAEHREAGWRIHAVEWTPEEATLEVDGRPMGLRGKIDRVDVRGEEWAILDYKTGEKQTPPGKAHRRRDGSWIDLQLPLYRHLARALELRGEPRLGYFTLGKDEDAIGFQWADEWTKEDVEMGLERARDVVRAVRAGDFGERGETPYEEILRAIWGHGMLATGEEAEA